MKNQNQKLKIKKNNLSKFITFLLIPVILDWLITSIGFFIFNIKSERNKIYLYLLGLTNDPNTSLLLTISILFIHYTIVITLIKKFMNSENFQILSIFFTCYLITCSAFSTGAFIHNSIYLISGLLQYLSIPQFLAIVLIYSSIMSYVFARYCLENVNRFALLGLYLITLGFSIILL